MPTANLDNKSMQLNRAIRGAIEAIRKELGELSVQQEMELGIAIRGILESE